MRPVTQNICECVYKKSHAQGQEKGRKRMINVVCDTPPSILDMNQC